MAKIIDEQQEEIITEEGEELTGFDEPQEEEQSQDSVEPEEETTADDLPEKYKGKDIKDIIAMHQNAEQLLGKQGQEVGELRRVVDNFIQSQTVKQQAHSTIEEFDENDFFENPKDAIQKLLNNHPSIQQSQQLAVQLKQQETLARLKASHPDFMDTIQKPEFAEWIQKSKVRTRLLQEADRNYDFDSADELLTLWKERQETLQSTVNTEKEERKKQVKTASTGTSKGSSERPSRKIYRRADIIELMRKDPERYQTLAPEIRQAYAEGRVK